MGLLGRGGKARIVTEGVRTPPIREWLGYTSISAINVEMSTMCESREMVTCEVVSRFTVVRQVCECRSAPGFIPITHLASGEADALPSSGGFSDEQPIRWLSCKGMRRCPVSRWELRGRMGLERLRLVAGPAGAVSWINRA
jgi:hypothetical protein